MRYNLKLRLIPGKKSEPMEVILKTNKVKNKTLESVSSRLRQIRRQIDCKQYVMGKMIGIGELTYAKNERGLHLPSSNSLIL